MTVCLHNLHGDIAGYMIVHDMYIWTHQDRHLIPSEGYYTRPIHRIESPLLVVPPTVTVRYAVS